MFIPVHEGCGDIVLLKDSGANKREMSNKMSNKEYGRYEIVADYLKQNGSIAKVEAARILEIEDKTAQRLLAKLVELGLLRSEGLNKGTIYMLNNKNG